MRVQLKRSQRCCEWQHGLQQETECGLTLEVEVGDSQLRGDVGTGGEADQREVVVVGQTR